MHIPENYLSPTTCAAMGAVMSVSYTHLDVYKRQILPIQVAFPLLFRLIDDSPVQSYLSRQGLLERQRKNGSSK